MSPEGPSVVGLGGGHGLAVTLSAMRRYAGQITAVVSVADDGGSSGRLRGAFGLPAPGDVRRCLVALADDPGGAWARAFGLRFEGGDVDGHALGNLVLAGLTEATGSFLAAVDEAARLLSTAGRVLPATLDPVVLTGDGPAGRLVGQTTVEGHGVDLTTVAIEPSDAEVHPDVVRAIAEADQVVLGPGSLYTSVLAVVAVPRIRVALQARAGAIVFVCNLKATGETAGYDVAAHVEALIRHGVTPTTVLVDRGGVSLGEVPQRVEVVEAVLAGEGGATHDPERLAAALERLTLRTG